ncbi:hypothetical protein FRC12_014739 [Ceratobasidium sp. 428]|nr:hypothetical protein FRC12_014739 [Ceratobasidium sp. 428]
MWDAYSEATEEGQRLKAHLVMLTHENRQLREQTQAHKKPKRTASEAAAASMAQRHGFLTNPEHEEAFRRGLEESEAKRRAEAEKTAQKEARAREIEENRSRIVADPNYAFEGTFQSFKHANMDRLGDLAACLGLPFTGLKKADLFERISQHFETHPGFKAMPKFSNLFRTSRAPRRATVQKASASVHSAEPADPGPPLPQLYTIDE